MAKLVLVFDNAVLKELALLESAVTIGRVADNDLQIENDPAVSSHHAKISLENGRYVIEDTNSTNGTYINGKRITKATLKHDDAVLIGKHTVEFEDPVSEDAGKTLTPKMAADATVVLDPRQALTPPPPAPAAVQAPAKDRVGTLTVLDGKTDQAQYVLTGKLTMIGKSEMATIKLKGMFAPKAAAVINRREGKYFIAAAEKSVKVTINDEALAGQREINDGDILEVAGVKLNFSLNE